MKVIRKIKNHSHWSQTSVEWLYTVSNYSWVHNFN